jgi:hypothetical protein
MAMEQKIIKSLTDIRNKIDSLDRDDLYSKTSAISSVLGRFFPKDTAYQRDLKQIRLSLGVLISSYQDTQTFGPDLEEIKSLTHKLLDNLISEAGTLGLPTISTVGKKAEGGINIHNNLSQSQQQIQTTNISLLLETVKDSLTGQQYKEIATIARQEPDPEKAKPKIVKKLLSFGGDVCSNIVASLLTSPDIWTKMLG